MPTIEQYKQGFWTMFTFYHCDEDSLSDHGWNVLVECFTQPAIM